MKKLLFLAAFIATTAVAQNARITNADTQPIPVKVSVANNGYDVTRLSASTTAKTWIAARVTRTAATLYNLDASITVYFKAAGTPTVTASNGFPLGPGQSKVINTTAGIQVIAASGTPALVADEEYRK